MPWPGSTKPSTPSAKDIIGMEAEELKTKLDSAATKEDVTAIQTQVTSSLAELKQTLDALKPQPASSSEENNEEPPDATVELITDPAKFIGKALKPIQEQQLKSDAQLMEMRARQNPTLAPYFSQYGKELIEAAEKMPVAMRAQGNFWEWHIRTIVGDKVVKGEIREGSFPRLLGNSVSQPVTGGTVKDANHGFSKEQVDWFKEHNVPIESAAAITNMYSDGEPITQKGYQTYKSQVTANA